MQSNFKSRIIIAVVIGLISLVSYYSKMQVNPVTGKRQAVTMSPQQEIAMGLQSAPGMAQEFGGLYQDARVQNAIKAMGSKIVNSSEAKDSPYQFDFHVLADPETINAFALPGGQIFITYGLLKRLTTEDQIAGVLGHEVGHVVGRHSAQQMAKDELTSGLLNAAVAATTDPYGSNTGAAMAQYIGKMVTMKYGRNDELEADKFGVKYLLSSGYNPEKMIDVMEILKEASGGDGETNFNSTHPGANDRIKEIKKAVEQYKKTGKLAW